MKTRSTNKRTKALSESAHIDDSAVVLFQGAKPLSPSGTVQLQSLGGDIVGSMFGRTVKDVKADFDKVSAQVNQVLSTAFSKTPGGLKLDNIEIKLGFSAEGKLSFIAKAGVEATVSITYKKL